MDSNHWQKCKELFPQLLERDPSDRAAFLDETCAGDDELRAELERLVASHESSESFLELPTQASLLSELPDERLIATRIGQFRLERVISSGGMGTVYEAVQENPKRKVAIKVLREGIATRAALRRFEYESRILARLTHPHVAQIIEAGTHRDPAHGATGGLPYFVMELVRDATPITDHARKRELPIRERLALFLQVCEAVHFGHLKGIIHRDLKPANILVDGEGQVKVIDFGVARATDSDLAVTTMFTDVGQLVGTLQYMSPEQCKADPADLDTRSDVYALGVVLYELLCDELPYEVGKSAVLEAARVICEREPKRPSSTQNALRGDVETIVLKALEKERSRRYQTVEHLEADIKRYLGGDLILARPVGPGTRMYKRVKRNPYLSAAVAAVVVLSVGFLLYVAFWSYPRIVEEMNRAREAEQDADLQRAAAVTARDEMEREANRAIAAEKDAELQREAALAARDEMEREANRVTAINLFLERMLTSPGPAQDGPEVKVVDVLDDAAKVIDASFPDQPDIAISLRKTIGVTYAALGRYEPGEEHLTRAVNLSRETLGEEDPDTLRIESSLAQVFKMQGRLDEAEEMLLRIVATQTRVLGEEHLDTLDARNMLAGTLRQKGRLEEAEELALDVLDAYLRVRGENRKETFDCMVSLVNIYTERGKLSEAHALLRRVIDVRENTQDADSPGTLISMNALASLHRRNGDYDTAEALYREAVEMSREVMGAEHSFTLSIGGNLAKLLRIRGELVEAEEMLREIISVQERVLGEDHINTASSLNTLGIILNTRGELDEAEATFRRALGIRLEQLGAQHYVTLSTENNVATVLQARGKLAEAQEIYESVLEGRIAILGEDHPETLATLNNLASVLMFQGDSAGAIPVFRDVVDKMSLAMGRNHPHTLGAKHNIAYALADLGDFEEAVAINREVLTARRATLGDSHFDTLLSMVELAGALANLDRVADAEPLLLEGLEIARATLPEDHEVTLRFLARLGDCRMRQLRFEEAEELLRHAYTGFADSLGDAHGKTRTIIKQLVELYDAWEKPEQAESWRAKGR